MAPIEKSKNKQLRILKTPTPENPAPESAGAPRAQAALKPVCPKCFGTGMEVVTGQGARRCDCQTSDHYERLFQAARIPARYRHCTLANYDAGNSEPMWIAKRE